MAQRLVRFLPLLAAFLLATVLLGIPVTPPWGGISALEGQVSAAPEMQATATPEPTPEPIPTPEAAPEVAVDLAASQAEIEAGQSVTYTVILTNTTSDPLASVEISGSIPPSTTFVADPSSPITYDATTGDLSWSAGDVPADTVLTATYQVQAQATLSDTQVVAAIAASSPDLTGTLSGWDVIDIGEPPTGTKWITPDGGALQAASSAVTLIVPTDALTEPLQFSIDPFTGTLGTGMWNAPSPQNSSAPSRSR
jgi:uncharacterized repeat protein (TIGR01451 family)